MAQEEREGSELRGRPREGWVAPPVSPSPLLDQSQLPRNQPAKVLPFFLEGLLQTSTLGRGGWCPGHCLSSVLPL